MTMHALNPSHSLHSHHSRLARAASHFSELLPANQAWFSPKEVAALVGKTDQYVRDCFDNQKIFGHTSNGRAKRGREQRRSYQIHRDGVLLFLLETANYEPDDFIDRLCELVLSRPVEEMLLILNTIEQARNHVTRATKKRGLPRRSPTVSHVA